MGFEIINQIKKEKGLTNAQISKMSGVTLSTLDKITSGINKNPKLDTLLAICKVLGCSLNDFVDLPNEKPAPTLSDEAEKIGWRWANLDRHGQTVVSVVMTEEEKRMEAERKARRSKKVQGAAADPDAPARVIPLFYTPSAAGFASPAFGEDFEYIDVGGEVPAYADFAVRIEGDSMEPYIPDGSTVYVNRDPLKSGDVGIFFLDGDMLCKQYVRNEEGDVWLLSLNRARADADRHISGDSGLTIACYGRVILPHPIRLAVPEEELL